MRARREDIPVVLNEQGAHSREVEWGDMNVAIEAWAAGLDATPLVRGLPDDRCQCPHWGYLFKGQIRIKYADYEEILRAGDVYYIAPGHILVFEEDCELVEFSPTTEYQKTKQVVARNMAAMVKSQ